MEKGKTHTFRKRKLSLRQHNNSWGYTFLVALVGGIRRCLAKVHSNLELYILIACIVLCSFVISHKTLDYTLAVRNVIWCVSTIVLFFLVTYRTIKGNVDFSILRRLIFPLFFCYFAVTALSVFQAANVSEAVFESARIFMMFAFLCTIAVVMKDKDVFIKSMILLGLCFAIYGIYIYFTMDDVSTRRGTMANKNLFASAILFFMVFAAHGLFYKQWFWRVLGIVIVALCLFSILTLRTRSVLLALFIFSLAASLRNRKALIGIIVCIIITLGVFYLRDYKTGGKTIFDSTSLSKQRLGFWKTTLQLSKDNPYGIGAGNWKLMFPSYARYMSDYLIKDFNVFTKIVPQRPHNDYLWVLSETSVVGLLFYLGIFGVGLWYSFRSKSMIIFGGILGYMAFAFFSFPKERIFHPMILITFLVLATISYHKKVKPLKIPIQWVYVLSLLVLSGLSFALVDFSYRYRTECYVRKMLELKKTMKFKNVDKWALVLDETEKYSWFANLDSTSTPIKYYEGIANYYLKDFRRAVKSFEQAREANPHHLYLLMNLGACNALQGKMVEAQKHYEQVVLLFPDFEEGTKCLETVRQVVKNVKGAKQ